MSSRPVNRQLIVLLVEDDDDTRFGLARTLAGEGYLALSAPTGHDAVGVMHGEAASVDAVLLDVDLPDVSGVAIQMLKDQMLKPPVKPQDLNPLGMLGDLFKLNQR